MIFNISYIQDDSINHIDEHYRSVSSSSFDQVIVLIQGMGTEHLVKIDTSRAFRFILIYLEDVSQLFTNGMLHVII